jgi:phosphoserine phosphatase RsbU/P
VNASLRLFRLPKQYSLEMPRWIQPGDTFLFLAEFRRLYSQLLGLSDGIGRWPMVFNVRWSALPTMHIILLACRYGGIMVTRDSERMQCMEVWGGNLRVEKQLQTPGLDIWISSQPEGDAKSGGDVYYVSSCASGRITRILLADVSGHGELVANIAVGLRDLMRQNINVIKQRRFVAAMNQQFAAASDDGDFATAIVSSFFAPTRSLSLSNAGHPTPLICRAANRRWTRLDLCGAESDSKNGHVTDLPLGVFPQTRYQQFGVRLDKGDMLLCYTDAFSESRAADGTILGVDGLLAIVAAIQETEGSTFLAKVVKTIRSLHPENLKQDDATILLIRANGKRTSIRDNLLAPFRLLGRVSDTSGITTPHKRLSSDESR